MVYIFEHLYLAVGWAEVVELLFKFLFTGFQLFLFLFEFDNSRFGLFTLVEKAFNICKGLFKDILGNAHLNKQSGFLFLCILHFLHHFFQIFTSHSYKVEFIIDVIGNLRYLSLSVATERYAEIVKVFNIVILEKLFVFNEFLLFFSQ